MMGDIYRNAAGVVVWLEPATKTTARTFDLMERIVAVTQPHELSSLDTYIMSQKEFLQACGLPTIQDQAWIHLDRLFWNPWYYRMWIIQEENFNRVSTFIKSKFKPPSSVNIFNSSDDTYIKISPNPVLNLNQIIEMFRQENQFMSLDRLLALSMNSVATWPVDKIYGILGLASGSVASTIVPRYDLSPENLFRSLTEQLVKTSLDILSQASVPRWMKTRNLPSWVPDWSQPVGIEPLLSPLRRVYAMSCGDTKPRVNVTSQTLVVSGLIVDTIVSVGYIYLPKRRDTTKQRVIKMKGLSVGIRMNSFFMNLLLNWENLSSSIVTHPTREAVGSVFARTLIANLDILDGENISYQDAYACFRDALLGHTVDHWPKAVQDAQPRYLQAFDTIAHGRCLVITSRDYMGLGPLSSSVGDKVV
ncbi:HET-domain-containing, partial [Fusarium albosuccineum]